MCVSECESNSVKLTRSNSVKVTRSNSVKVTRSNSVKVTQINSTQSDNRSGGEMGEENVETAKSELRLGMKCILHREYVYTQMKKGECNLVWSGSCNECRHHCSVCFLMPMTLYVYT